MFQVVSIGNIVQDPACYAALSNKPIVYPDHYTVNRAVFVSPTSSTKPVLLYKDTAENASAAAAKAMEEPYFVATISVVPATDANTSILHFRLTRSDKPTEKVYTGVKSATTVWRAALDDAAKDFPDRKAQLLAPCDGKGHLLVNGIRLFGLHCKDVQEELLALPGGAEAFENAAAALQSSPSQVSPPASQPSLATKSASEKRRSLSKSPVRGTATKSPSRKRVNSTASIEKNASTSSSSNMKYTLVMEDTTGNSNSQRPPVVVAVGSPTKPKRSRKPKTENVATSLEPNTTAEETVKSTDNDGNGATSPAKPRRAHTRKSTNAKNNNESDVANTSSSATAAVVSTPTFVCPECGLAGTPFCAATGKPHEAPPCPVCGLRSAFCPVSGKPHVGAVQRENRQRGEVHLPSASRKPRRKPAAVKAGEKSSTRTTPENGEVVEVTVVNTQNESGDVLLADISDAAMKPRKKRVRPAFTPEGVANGEGDDKNVPARTRRRRSTKHEDAAASVAKNAGSASPTTTNGEDSVMPPPPSGLLEGDRPLFDIAKESVYIYPPLRPPLSVREHHKAAQLLQENWKTQYGDGLVLPPAVAAVPLTLVPAKRTAATAETAGGGAAKGRRKGRGAATVKEEHINNTDVTKDRSSMADDLKDAADHNHLAEATEAEDNMTACSSTVASPTTPASSAALPSMVHPLEVTQIASSAAGKRLTKFLLQYTSERTQLDLLRSHAAATGNTTEKKKPIRRKSQTNGQGCMERGVAVQETDAGPEAAELDTSATVPTEMLKSKPDEEIDGLVDEERGAVEENDAAEA